MSLLSVEFYKVQFYQQLNDMVKCDSKLYISTIQKIRLYFSTLNDDRAKKKRKKGGGDFLAHNAPIPSVLL